MPLLPRRFERLKSVLNQRMADLTVLLEHVEKPAQPVGDSAELRRRWGA